MYNENEIINDWNPEVISLLERLRTAGFKIKAVSDGEEWTKYSTQEKAVEVLTSTDDGCIRIEKDGLESSLILVFGNSPGELVSDYTYPPGDSPEVVAFEKAVNEVTSAHYDSWIEKPQPKTTRLAKYGKRR